MSGTNPMTHPLTPREKVAQIIKEKVSGPHFTDPSHFVAMEQDRFVAADAILTAIASGSGDHAELVLMANAALEIYSDDVLVVGGTRRIHADNIILYVKNGVDALLAENAALRADLAKTERDFSELRDGYDRVSNKLCVERAHGGRETKRATEAERKLAEAVGMLREHDENRRFWDEPEPSSLADRTIAFLSNEVERG